jgi:DnaJ like chaperone protein
MSWKAISQLLGVDPGGSLRDALAALWSGLGLDRLTVRTPAHRTVAFTIAVTTLAAKMAKADGVALPVEAAAFERLFQIPPEQIANTRRLFDLGAQDVAGYEVYAAKIARMLKDEPELLRSVLECLFHIAAADGVLHPAEDTFLANVAECFGLTRREYLAMRASYVHDPCSPYEILGCRPDASDADLKARHRALVREHHPDQLAASGVPPEFRAAADRRLAAINAAYDTIRKERAEEPSGDLCTCGER